MSHVLLVDDDPAVRRTLARFVTRLGHTVSHAADGEQGCELLLQLRPDLVITDMEMPNGTGFVVLDAGIEASIPVVILTAHASVEMAVDAMKRGASNFLAKPFSAESVAQLLQEAFDPGAKPVRPPRVPGMPTPAAVPSVAAGPSGQARSGRDPRTEVNPVGEDESFKAVLGIVERVADTDATILLTGESGTGKEVVARAIHNASPRRDRAFVVVNCGAIPEALLESELFGHVRGAFTGATQARRGRFALADGGTLFLDEIGDMPPSLQVKLLRVIQEREYEVLGDSRTVPTNVRFIAATHRNLDQMVDEGTFREDLFYRLNVVPLNLPPLRDRARDIPLLVAHFISEANFAHQRTVDGLTADALASLCAYGWPGNVRELCNIVERMVVLRGAGTLELHDVPASLRLPRDPAAGSSVGAPALPSAGIDLGEALQRIEGVLIAQALERTRGNRTQAAALLRINRTTLVEKLKRREGGGDEET